MRIQASQRALLSAYTQDTVRVSGANTVKAKSRDKDATTAASKKVNVEAGSLNIDVRGLRDKFLQSFNTGDKNTRTSRIVDAINNRASTQRELLDALINGELKADAFATLDSESDEVFVKDIGVSIISQAKKMGLSDETASRIAGDFADEYKRLSSDPANFSGVGDNTVQALRNLASRGWPEFNLASVPGDAATLPETISLTASEEDTLTIRNQNTQLIYDPTTPEAIAQAEKMQEWTEGLAASIAAIEAESSRSKLMIGNYEVPGDVLNSKNASHSADIKTLTSEQAAQIKEGHPGGLSSVEEKAAFIVDLARAGLPVNGLLLTLRDIANGTETPTDNPIQKKLRKVLKSDNFIEDFRDFLNETNDYLNKEYEKVKQQQAALRPQDNRQYRRQKEYLNRYRANIEGGLKVFSPLLESFALLLS